MTGEGEKILRRYKLSRKQVYVDKNEITKKTVIKNKNCSCSPVVQCWPIYAVVGVARIVIYISAWLLHNSLSTVNLNLILFKPELVVILQHTIPFDCKLHWRGFVQTQFHPGNLHTIYLSSRIFFPYDLHTYRNYSWLHSP